jgi:hypothetical protein
MIYGRGLHVAATNDCQELGKPLPLPDRDYLVRDRLTYSPDGQHILTNGWGAARLWRADYFENGGNVLDPADPKNTLETWLKLTGQVFR